MVRFGLAATQSLLQNQSAFHTYANARFKAAFTKSVGMDSYAVPCRRSALRAGDGGLGHHVQRPWYLEHKDRALHKLAESAVGCQTTMESGSGYSQDAPIVGLGDAIDRGCWTG